MVSERVMAVGIENEMRQSYLAYAMSVIVSRALPDVRDGLKPVQRRIIYAMGELGIVHPSPTRKSARIVGEVLGKFHPHNDVAVYDALVRMAQDFSLRYPLVEGQGNFGSVDGDGAAAMRYTEARLAPIAREMLADIDHDTVDFTSNFDESLQEPEVLPARLPNLLVNGSSGIAVGMSTNVPPHNLGEVCDAVVYLLKNYDHLDDVNVDDIMKFVPGPDFPTGGIIYSGDENGEVKHSLRRAYATGRGRVVVRAKAALEQSDRGLDRIIVTELPYQTNKARLVERIAELVRSGRLKGIADVRDESDRHGMRLVLEVARGAEPREVLSDLYRLTPMQSTFSIIMLALVNGEPRTLSLKRLLLSYIEHRLQVIERRSEHDLVRAREREHVLAGLLIALDRIDEVIDVIRRSRTAETARKNLRKRFRLSERQAQAILDMPLRRLASLERRRIDEEHEGCLSEIARLETLLADPSKMREVVCEEVEALKRDYGDQRRTHIVQGSPSDQALTVGDLVPDRTVLIVADIKGRVSQMPLGRRIRVHKGAALAVTHNLRERAAFVLDSGRALVIPVHRLPEGLPADALSVAQTFGANENEQLVAVVPMPDGDEAVSVLLATANGKAKRIPIGDMSQSLRSVMRLDEGDAVVAATIVNDSDSVFLVSSGGRAIAFDGPEVRVMGLSAGGVAGMRLNEGERVVAACRRLGQHLVVASATGYIKRVSLRRLRTQRRGGAGVTVMSVSDATGELVAGCCTDPVDTVFASGSLGSVTLLKAGEIPVQTPASRGRRLAKLRKRESVVSVSRLVDEH